MKLNEINRNETLRYFETNKNKNINELIIRHGFNTHKIYKKYITIKKIRDIIFILLILFIVIGLIVFLIIYNNKEKQVGKLISFKQYINNVDDFDGYYIPKDATSRKYVKCSVEKCKKCYGNSYNNTCLSCIKYYEPIRDENNKIIMCKFNPQIEDDSNIIDSTEYIIENTTIVHSESFSEAIKSNTLETKTELLTQINLDTTTPQISKEQFTTEKINIICEPGYYIPEGDNDNIDYNCQPCSEIGCETCHGDIQLISVIHVFRIISPNILMMNT